GVSPARAGLYATAPVDGGLAEGAGNTRQHGDTAAHTGPPRWGAQPVLASHPRRTKAAGTEEDQCANRTHNKAPYAYVLGGMTRTRGCINVPGTWTAQVVWRKVYQISPGGARFGTQGACP